MRAMGVWGPCLLVLAGCASGGGSAGGVERVVDEDLFAKASERLANRIGEGARVAVAEPVLHLPFDLSPGLRKSIEKQLPENYSLRMEGGLVEAIRTESYPGPVPKVVTRVHLDPILAEADLRWALINEDAQERARLATLTDVDTLVLWHLHLDGENASVNGFWHYSEEWTVQAVRIKSGELLGSVTLRRDGQRLRP